MCIQGDDELNKKDNCSFSFFSLYLSTQTIPVYNSIGEQERLHYHRCSMFANNSFLDQLSRRVSHEIVLINTQEK
jgi:hypothetical protein